MNLTVCFAISVSEILVFNIPAPLATKFSDEQTGNILRYSLHKSDLEAKLYSALQQVTYAPSIDPCSLEFGFRILKMW